MTGEIGQNLNTFDLTHVVTCVEAPPLHLQELDYPSRKPYLTGSNKAGIEPVADVDLYSPTIFWQKTNTISHETTAIPSQNFFEQSKASTSTFLPECYRLA